jgi:threonine 3-dehydrogenase
MAAAVLERMPEVNFTYRADPARDAIVQSWPFALDDAESARDWSWEAELDLAAMTERMLAALTAEG